MRIDKIRIDGDAQLGYFRAHQRANAKADIVTIIGEILVQPERLRREFLKVYLILQTPVGLPLKQICMCCCLRDDRRRLVARGTAADHGDALVLYIHPIGPGRHVKGITFEALHPLDHRHLRAREEANAGDDGVVFVGYGASGAVRLQRPFRRGFIP